MKISYRSMLAVIIVCGACAPETAETAKDPLLPVSPRAITPPTLAPAEHHGAAGSAPSSPSAPATPAAPAPGAIPMSPRPESATPVPAPAMPTPAVPTPATPAPPMAPGGGMNQPPPPSAAAGGTAADKFCDKYGEHCGYAMPNRHADRAACIADFNATPVQQGCKNMHMDTAIAGTAAACNGMPSAFCFSIHCLHVAGIADPTGVTYCK